MKFLIPIFSLMLLSSHLHAMENVNKPEQKTTANDKKEFGLITDEDLDSRGLGYIKAQRENLLKRCAPSEATLEAYYKTHKIYETAKKNRPDLVDPIKKELLNLYLYEHCRESNNKEIQLKSETTTNINVVNSQANSINKPVTLAKIPTFMLQVLNQKK